MRRQAAVNGFQNSRIKRVTGTAQSFQLCVLAQVQPAKLIISAIQFPEAVVFAYVEGFDLISAAVEPSEFCVSSQIKCPKGIFIATQTFQLFITAEVDVA